MFRQSSWPGTDGSSYNLRRNIPADRSPMGGKPIRMKVDNGPLFIFEPMPWLQSASLGFFIPTGSGHEPSELGGITHFIEHLVFKGTETKSPKDIALAFEGVGGLLNASTGREFMDIYGRIGSRNLKRGFNVIADMILRPRFLQSDIDKERGVILEEIRMTNDLPDQFLFEQFSEQVWGRSQIAKPIAGSAKSLSSITRKDVLKWFRERYDPKYITISMAGDVYPDSVLDWWREIARDNRKTKVLKNSSTDHELKPIKPGWRSGVKVYHRDVEQAIVIIGFPAPSSRSPERYPFSIVETLLGGGMGARLFQEVREKSGLTYDIESGYSPLSGVGVFTIDTATAPKMFTKLIARIIGELRKLRTKLAGKTELQRVKDFIEGNTLLGMESSSNRMMRNGISQMYLGETIPTNTVMNLLTRVTSEDVIEISNRYFTFENFACGILAPEGLGKDEEIIDGIMKTVARELS